MNAMTCRSVFQTKLSIFKSFIYSHYRSPIRIYIWHKIYKAFDHSRISLDYDMSIWRSKLSRIGSFRMPASARATRATSCCCHQEVGNTCTYWQLPRRRIYRIVPLIDTSWCVTWSDLSDTKVRPQLTRDKCVPYHNLTTIREDFTLLRERL